MRRPPFPRAKLSIQCVHKKRFNALGRIYPPGGVIASVGVFEGGFGKCALFGGVFVVKVYWI